MAKRSKEHKKVQLQGKIRDLYVCQICGSTNQVEGHHIFDYAFGGSANIDNIITLCHDCHVAVHHGFIDISIF